MLGGALAGVMMGHLVLQGCRIEGQKSRLINGEGGVKSTGRLPSSCLAFLFLFSLGPLSIISPDDPYDFDPSALSSHSSLQPFHFAAGTAGGAYPRSVPFLFLVKFLL